MSLSSRFFGRGNAQAPRLRLVPGAKPVVPDHFRHLYWLARTLRTHRHGSSHLLQSVRSLLHCASPRGVATTSIQPMSQQLLCTRPAHPAAHMIFYFLFPCVSSNLRISVPPSEVPSRRALARGLSIKRDSGVQSRHAESRRLFACSASACDRRTHTCASEDAQQALASGTDMFAGPAMPRAKVPTIASSILPLILICSQSARVDMYTAARLGARLTRALRTPVEWGPLP